MTECRGLCTKSSDESITASRRNDYQQRVSELLKSSSNTEGGKIQRDENI